MDLIRPFSQHVLYPLLLRKNRNSDFRYVKQADELQFALPEALSRLQAGQLRSLLVHAKKHCPFYARRFAASGFEPSSVRSLSDIASLPLLTKRQIQENREALMADNLRPSEMIPNQTGGSTGSPLRFMVGKPSHYRRIANTIRHDRWAGLEPYHKAASIWGHRRDLSPPHPLKERLRDALIFRRIILDASALDEVKLRGFIDRLLKERPSTYVAYANAIFLLARYIQARGLHEYHRPASIITSAEVLADEQRALIEGVFGCPVFNRYGCREFSVVASECSHHTGMHIASDTLLVEILRNGEQCPVGEVGEVVITDLFNYAMPFIRYRIGDVGRLLAENCGCGRTLPLMQIVGGRITDFIVTPEGVAVSGASLTIFFIARIRGIAQAQLIQKERDRIAVRIVADDKFDRDSESAIAQAVRDLLGPRMRHEIELVDSIPSEPSGKYRFSISEIDPLAFMNGRGSHT